MDLAGQRILILAPHPDDEVIGCGGLIAKAKRLGAHVSVLVFTIGDTPDRDAEAASERITRLQELEDVAAFLCIDETEVVFPDGGQHLRLDTEPQRELVDAIERRARLSLASSSPSIVLLPDAGSYNQDHRAVAAAAMTALRPVPARAGHVPQAVFTYEQLVDHWTAGSTTSPRVTVELSEHDVQKKLSAMQLYRSQARPSPNPRSNAALEAMAKVRGMQAGVALAEAFGCVRLLM